MHKKIIFIIMILIVVVCISFINKRNNKVNEASGVIVEENTNNGETAIIRNKNTNEIMYEVPKGDAYLYTENPDFNPSFGEQIKSEKKEYFEN